MRAATPKSKIVSTQSPVRRLGINSFSIEVRANYTESSLLAAEGDGFSSLNSIKGNEFYGIVLLKNPPNSKFLGYGKIISVSKKI